MHVEQIVMSIITYSGNAKSDSVEAIQAAKAKNSNEARRLIAKAEEELLNAHHVQTSLIQNEARGNKTEITLLLVHAQDHLMNAITFKDLAKEFVELYESMNQ
ncbi:PTS mannose transporter subunit IIA [Heyndrickxia sporothermodurans]|nr:PTS mannose transporter subunit IIA [Heyndrickxia sporothermodurans]